MSLQESVAAEPATVIYDQLQKELAYPLSAARLRAELSGVVAADSIGLFFLYSSGIQSKHYDPRTSRAQSYPILVLDNGLPPLSRPMMRRLFELELGRQEMVGEPSSSEQPAAGVNGQPDPASCSDEVSRQLLAKRLPATSLLIFPVKARLKQRTSNALDSMAVRAMKNWLSVSPDIKSKQRPLLLVFDEPSGRLVTKFAETWDGDSARRLYR